MTVFIAIAIFVFIIYHMGKKKPVRPKPNYPDPSDKKIVALVTALQAKDSKNHIHVADINNSVIDVTGQSSRINTDNGLKPYPGGVPYWEHHYVFSHTELSGASAVQRAFYHDFKAYFLKGEYFDLEGNSNYAFILLFDLVNDYDLHKDMARIENELRILGECYPKTTSYGQSALKRKMRQTGDDVGIERINIQNTISYYAASEDDNYYWKLGTKYKTRLGLSATEVKQLNKLWFSNNNFCGIEHCLIATLGLYVRMMRELEEHYVLQGTSLKDQLAHVADVVAVKQYKNRKGSQSYIYAIDTAHSQAYGHLFKHCENVVREHYGHKRKLNTDTPFTVDEAKATFDALVAVATNLLTAQASTIEAPDEATDIALYAQNTSRWKIKFEQLTASYGNDPKVFIENIVALGKLNKNNPSVENIFFEASKFMAKHHNESALVLYVHYLFHDLKSAAFDNKQLTKTIQKSLFKTNDQLYHFETLISDLIIDKDLDKALKAVPAVYRAKRKKIQLDTSAIKEAQEQHSDTVDLLNEYLQDDFEDEHNTIRSQEISNEEIKIEITLKQEEAVQSAFASGLAFTPVHVTLLELFAKQNFSVHHDELEIFARSKGVFKNQLVESINDSCYDMLDDVLIEEEDDYYTINTQYFQKITAT